MTMEVYRQDQDATPWDMPKEVFWDITTDAHLRRADWVLRNRPDVSLDELMHSFCLHDEELAELKILGIDSLLAALRAEPRLLPDKPKDEEIIETYKKANILTKDFNRKLTFRESRGFLEIWQRTTSIKSLIARFTDEELNEAETSARERLESDKEPEKQVRDLRFLRGKILQEQSARTYKAKDK